MAIEVFDNWGDFDTVVCYGLGQNRLVSHVSDETGPVLVEHKSCGLATSCESLVDLTFLDLVNVTVRADSKKIAFAVLRGAIKRHCQLKQLLVVGRRCVRGHFSDLNFCES